MADDAATPKTPNRAAPRKRLGGFELLGRLGKGGMGTVLKARQVSMDRLVALKILPRKLAEDAQFVQRFLREARSAARLRHPNIVQAYDVGQVEGYYFFAMEFVDGETLSDIVGRGGPLEQERALAVMKQVASALAAAHDAGVIHRDIKPSNIMLDNKGEVRVTDFGLAKRAEGDTAVTADGSIVGTPAFLAPEMAQGLQADGRSDIYSLGATIFYALAGRPPFEGKHFSEVLVKQATEPAPPLATFAPRVDRRLCYVIDRLLRKGPAERYPSAGALLDDLEGLGRLQAVLPAAHVEAPAPEASDGLRLRRRRIALAAAGVLLAVIAGLVVIRLRSDRTRPPTAAPPRPATQVEAKAVASGESPPTAGPSAVPAATTEGPSARKGPARKSGARKPPATEMGDWTPLFDGKSLSGWRVVEDGPFRDHGPVGAVEGELRMLPGRGPGPTTAIAYTGAFPQDNYEVEIEAMRTDGTLDFADLVFPLGDETCSLLVGAHTGGNLIGLRSMDRQEPWQHDGHSWPWFRLRTWYRVRLRVAPDELAVWVNDEEKFAVPRAGHHFDAPWVLGDSKPFGVVAYMAGSAIRSLRVRSLDPGPPPGVKPAEWAAWTDLRSRARELTRAGQYDEAVRLLRTGRIVPTPAIEELVDREVAAVDVARREAAYARESEKVWALFQERRYGEADKLLTKLAGRLAPEAGEPHSVRDMVQADIQAATHLKNFWFGVERGAAKLSGSTYSDGAVTGQLISAEKGMCTIQTGAGLVTRPVRELDPRRAELYHLAWRSRGGYVELPELVFVLAELGAPTVADKRRIISGKRVSSDFFDRRRDALPPAPEFYARQAWRELEAAVKANPTKAEAERLLSLLDPFEETYAKTKHFASVREKLADIRAQAHIAAGTARPPARTGSLFDGTTLAGWEPARGGYFVGNVASRLSVADGAIAIGASSEATGVRCTQDLPTTSYELTFEVSAIKGSTWAGSALFPLGGGAGLWEIRTGDGGPNLVARSTAEGLKDVRSRPFAMANGTWYRFRLRVDEDRVQAWINDQQVFDCPRRGYDFGFWPGWAGAGPLGFFTCSGAMAKVRNIRIQALVL